MSVTIPRLSPSILTPTYSLLKLVNGDAQRAQEPARGVLARRLGLAAGDAARIPIRESVVIPPASLRSLSRPFRTQRRGEGITIRIDTTKDTKRDASDVDVADSPEIENDSVSHLPPPFAVWAPPRGCLTLSVSTEAALQVRRLAA